MMPSKDHALIYTAVKHYLRGVDKAGTDEAVAVNKAMRAAPVDYFGRPATVRGDGRVLFDLTLYRVKKPAESKAPWDYYEKVRDIPAAEAFLPANPLLHKLNRRRLRQPGFCGARVRDRLRSRSGWLRIGFPRGTGYA